MPEQSKLAEAIQQGVTQWRAADPVREDDIRVLASIAKKVNEEALSFLSTLPKVEAEKHYVSLQLIRAAFDHGRGLLYLIESNPRDMGGPALALHRSQIESFLRGVFLGFLATDEQINDFLENDQGIREKNQKDKWQNIGVSTLARRVEEFINELSDETLDDPEKFSRMVSNTWTPLCGFVHGGRAIHALYRDGQGQIGSDISISILVQCISNCYVITNFAFAVVIGRIYNIEGVPDNSPLYRAMQEFAQLQVAIRSRQKMFGAP